MTPTASRRRRHWRAAISDKPALAVAGFAANRRRSNDLTGRDPRMTRDGSIIEALEWLGGRGWRLGLQAVSSSSAIVPLPSDAVMVPLDFPAGRLFRREG